MSEPVFFWGGTFSQWYRAPFTIDDVDYRTAEHFMMASKAVTFDDEVALSAILSERDPAKAKQIGRTIKGWDEEVWKKVRFQIVCRGSYEKFRQNPGLLFELVATGDREIVEASPYDKVWGIGLGEAEALQAYKDQVVDGPNLFPVWPGLNLLGKALMAAQTMLQPQ